MTATSAGAAGPDADLPDWLRALAAAAREVRGEDMSRFLPPEDGSGRDAAVLIALGEVPDAAGTPRPSVLLIQRAADMRTHAGQVAFPGGAIDPADGGPVAAALREAREEVGLDAGGVVPFAELPAVFIPVTGFVVTPVLAWWRAPHRVAPVEVAEVARVAVVAIDALTAPAHRFRVRHPSGWLGPGFEVDGLFVWGFTAGLLDRLLVLAGWARAWDPGAERELPPELVGRRPTG